MDLLSRVNVDLLGPLLIVFALLRLKNHYCVPLKLLSGLRFFVSNITLSQKHLRAPQSASSIKEQSIIDKKLNEFNLSMIELDGSVRKGSILSGLMMYDTYETLIYISLSSVAVHFFSSVFHCFSPTSMYSIWGTIFVTMSVILPFRALMRILFLTGFEAFESRISLIACAFIFMLSAALLFGPLDVLGLAFDDVLSITAIHFNALLLQLSHTAPQLSEHVMVAMIKVVLSALTAMTAVGMVIPAMRFSQSFNTLLFGARYERATLKMRALLVFDHLMPLIVAASMIPSSLGIPTSLRTDGFLLAMQLTTTFLMVAVRLHCLRKHLQCFLDAIVQAISIEIATNASTDAKKIQDQVAARLNYIPAAAVQYVSVPLCALGLALLVHKSAIAGTGLCVGIRSALGMDTQIIHSSTASTLAFDATAAALDMTKRGEPTFMSGMHLFLMSAGAFVSLGRVALCVHCLLWFTISSSAILYWYLSPISLKKATGGILLKKKDE